jgi:hypothetical protein
VQCKGSDGSVVADNVCAGTKLTSQTCTASCSGIPISQSCNTQACPTNGSCGTVHGTNRTSAPSTTTEKCSAGTASSVSGSGPWTWTCAGSNGGTNASCSASKLTAQCGLNKGECRLGQLTGSIYGDEGTNEWWWQCRGGSQVETCVIPVCTNSNYPALGYNGMNSDNLFYCCPNESAAKTCGDSVNKNGFPNYHYGTAECSSCQ